jgi:hypothetical protein
MRDPNDVAFSMLEALEKELFTGEFSPPRKEDTPMKTKQYVIRVDDHTFRMTADAVDALESIVRKYNSWPRRTARWVGNKCVRPTIYGAAGIAAFILAMSQWGDSLRPILARILGL